MSEGMNLSVNGQSQVPPGFRFHPTEEELLHYYLRKKVASQEIDLDVIRDVDLNKLEPWDIQEKCRIGTTPQNDWYFFSHKDKKYPTGTRTNRATAAGFWKATGRDKVINSSSRRIGMRKTLVFYMGRAPHGQKSDWIMHEYRLEEHNNAHNTNTSDSMPEDGWVVCRVFRKKDYQRSLESPKSSSTAIISRTQMLDSISNNDDEALDQILLYMGRNCKQENDNISNNINLMANSGIDHSARFHTVPNNTISIVDDRFMHLPRLDSPTLSSSLLIPNHNVSPYDQLSMDETRLTETEHATIFAPTTTGCDPKAVRLNDWAALHRLVASQLNGHVTETSKQLSCFSDPNNMAPFIGLSSPDRDVQLSHQMCGAANRPIHASQIYASEIDLWSFTRSSSSSSSDPLSHLSV